MKSYVILAICALMLILSSCNDNANRKEQDKVLRQQEVYLSAQASPFFEWSLQRQLWADFYKAQNSAVSTWSYITPQNTPHVVFETRSQGYPIPMDTQLTNPLQAHFGSGGYTGAVIEQAEPNGLFSSKNSDGTIIMAANDDGTLSPIYTEMKVTTFPFPVRWDNDLQKWVRLEGQPTVKLQVEKSSKVK